MTWNRWAVLVGVAASAIGLGAVVAGSSPAHAVSAGRTYYLDPSGSDSADGLSPDRAWRSLDRANQFAFRSGDTLLLRGNTVFTGMLQLDDKDFQAPGFRLTVGSFGDGRATVANPDNSAIFVHDAGRIEIRDLVVSGGGAAYTKHDGITLYNDTTSYIDDVTITGVDVSGFKNGISAGGKTVGFRDLKLTHSMLHDNLEAGFITYGPTFDGRYAHKDVEVSAVEAYRIAGDRTNTVRNTGSGIVLGSVRGGKVEWSTAHDNGWDCIAPEGPAGIWSYDSTAVVIENNIAHHNRTGGPADGDGFDLDQNTSASTIQYNVAYDNAGAGVMLYAARDGTTNRDNVIRYNTVKNSTASSDWYGALSLIGNITGAQLYGNTVLASQSAHLRPPGIRLLGPLAGVSVRENMVSTQGDTPLVAASGFPNHHVTMQANLYGGTSEWSVVWGDAAYGSLGTWRAATGQEPA